MTLKFVYASLSREKLLIRFNGYFGSKLLLVVNLRLRFPSLY